MLLRSLIAFVLKAYLFVIEGYHQMKLVVQQSVFELGLLVGFQEKDLLFEFVDQMDLDFDSL